MSESMSLRAQAVREAGAVQRCHILPHSGSYTIAEHTHGAMDLLLLLHPEPSLSLIKAVQWHDCAERWLGDMPAPAKWEYPELKQAYEQAEHHVMVTLSLLQILTAEEAHWLAAVDTLELWLWCREEVARGNRAAGDIREKCAMSLEVRRVKGVLPGPIHAFYAHESGRELYRLSDAFMEVQGGLRQAES